MHERLSYSEGASRIADRRKHPRVQIKSLAYIQLEEANGGLIFNISEGGISVQTGEMLIGTAYKKMSFRLPGSPQWIEVNGKLVWEGASRKEAGIQFVDVDEDVRQRIQNWVQAAASCPDTPADAGHATIVWENEKLSFPPVDSDKVIVPAGFEAMFPSEKSLPSEPPQRASSISTLFPSETVQADACKNRAPLTSSTESSSDSAVATFETDVFDPAKVPPNQSNLPDYPPLERTVVGVNPAQPNDVARESLNCDELSAWHATAMNSHSLQPSSVDPQTRLREAAPTVHNPASRPITFTGLGYQAAAFEEPSGKGWLWVAAILVVLLALGAALAVGPANLKTLLAGHNHATVAGPPPPRSASEKTGPSAPYSSSQSENAAQEPVPTPGKHVQTSQSSPNAIITETDHESFPPYAEHSDKSDEKDVARPDSPDAEAETRRFQREHSQTGNVGANASQPAPNGVDAFPRQQVVPPGNGPVPPPTGERQNDRAHDAYPDVNPQDSYSSANAPSPLAPQPPPQIPAMPSGTVAIRSTFHSIWGSQSPPSSSDGVLLIGQLVSIRQPIYPVEAERTHVQGTIELRVIVDQAGAVEIVQLVSGPPILAPAAINAVREWRYARTTLNGRTVQSVEDISVVFHVGNSASSPR